MYAYILLHICLFHIQSFLIPRFPVAQPYGDRN